MVRQYKRRTNKGDYDKDQLREAVMAVRSGNLTGYKASKLYKIPRMTIMDHVHNKRSSSILGRRTTLPSAIESNLAHGIRTMEKYGFGLTRAEILDMVGTYIIKNEIATCFKNGIPGKDWFVSFANRHNLSIKKPQAVEYARKTAIDPFIIYPYFDLLEKTINELGLQQKPHAIWNVDETSFAKDPSKSKIVGAKGHAATRTIASPGKDNTTVLLGANAAGQKIPPLIIFKGKNVWDEWTSADAYPGTTYAATKNGWMESDIFEAFFKKSFLPAIGEERPVLLIYDGHSTHVGLNLIEEARKAHVTIIKLPAHSSHVLQPLDVAVMKSFKTQWDVQLVKWQRLNIGIPLPKKEFSRLIGSIWREINPQILRNGFRKAGIYPVNRNEISHHIFDPLQLSRWQQNIQSVQQSLQKEPKSLLLFALEALNKVTVQTDLECKSITNDNKPEHILTQTATNRSKVTFEDLLIEKVKRGESSKVKKRKIAPGAEVITHDDVIKFKIDEQSKPKTIQSTKHCNEVVLISGLSKNDSQCMPFTAQNSNELPNCLKNSDKSNVKILSDIIIKSPSQALTHTEPGPSNIKLRKAKAKIINRVAASIKITKKSHTRNTPRFSSRRILAKENRPRLGKIPPNNLSRSSSTTSVSGTCSNHSDSDIVNVSSDSDSYSDTLFKEITNNYNDTNSKSPKTRKHIKTEKLTSQKNILRSKSDNVNDKTIYNAIYSINDHIIARYYNRKWTYYVGMINDIRIRDGELYYNTRFYKTLRKPELHFKMMKKIDQDEISHISIVKKTHLVDDKQINGLKLAFQDDELYFN